MSTPMNTKPDLHIVVGGATHFLRWEIPELEKYFNLVSAPSINTLLISFGPDILEKASKLPALKRFAVTFPGFSINPLRDLEIRAMHTELFKNFETVFINHGPLEIAYEKVGNIEFYPFSIDMELVKLKSYRKRLTSLIHVSNPAIQKDWERSEAVMLATGLNFEVYPTRSSEFYAKHIRKGENYNRLRRKFRLKEKHYLPEGYVNHKTVVKKYQEYDGFVHVASDKMHPLHIDGKYTASLIEAGVTGSILFWHDTYKLGNGLRNSI
ncbi:MAG: hypothetical protein V9G25_00290 [Acidimicrobiia bacterium]